MKKLLLIVFLMAPVLKMTAQVCTPDTTITTPGLYPDSLPDANAGILYNETIQFKFPTDTTVSGSTVPIDSVRIINVAGFPSGFTYACNRSDCSYKGGDNGCVVLSGTPSTSQSGNYEVVITVEAKVKFGEAYFWIPFTDTIPFRVNGPSWIKKYREVSYNFSLAENYPNPFAKSTVISYTLPYRSSVTFSVYDILGNVVIEENLSGQAGENNLQFQRGSIKAGMYFFSLRFGDKTITRKMVVRD
ncbi:MAG: T9SS type A sorting domain-containing protein [Bacteroidota bacterium]|nr:T9SS type A sorting domain-containing protein [Bacteroidota bacterium]